MTDLGLDSLMPSAEPTKYIMSEQHAVLAIIWSLKLCLCSMFEAKSAWLPSMCGAKSALLPSMCRAKSANLLRIWMGARQTLLCTWQGAMQTLLCSWSGDIVSGTNKLLKLQFLLIFNKKNSSLN